MLAATAGSASAEIFELKPIVVESTTVHESQKIRQKVNQASDKSRSSSYVGGSVIQNISPVNKLDALRSSVPGIVNQPFSGDRFGGGTNIRTLGDWGASLSIDGLPAFKSAGEEGGGYGNTLVPSIALESIGVLKGGRAVQYGDGTDGGVVEYTIKSGRNYKDHQAVSLDASTAKEGLIQGEIADSTDVWDYYFAGSGFHGAYSGDPDLLDRQSVFGGVGKLGWNPSEDTRVEFLGIVDYSQPQIFRLGAVNKITTKEMVTSATVDSKLSGINSVRVGLLAQDSKTEWPARRRNRSVNNQIAFADHYLDADLSPGIRYDGSVGAEYKHTNALRDKQWDNNFNDLSLLSRNALTFDDNLVVNAGLRLTWFNNDIEYLGVGQPDNLQTDVVLAHELGASYSLFEQTRVRASWATGYNRFFEKYGNFGTDALNLSGAADEVVESRTLEIGINQGFRGGYVDVALYNIVQDNVPRRNAGMIEGVEVDQSGLEIEAFLQLTDDLTVSLGYMRMLDLKATRADGTDANTNIFFGADGTSVPDDQFNLRAEYNPADEWGLWLAAYALSGYEAVNLDDTVTKRDGYVRLDLGASWQIEDDWALRFRVENVLDERDFGETISGLPVNEGAELGRVFWIGTDIVL
ncbi:MAG: TonB-dependent receptor [Alphaproteobacteria bacterium]